MKITHENYTLVTFKVPYRATFLQFGISETPAVKHG